ncbi:MAG: cysteine hydrolase [Clostridia bacterium]|nr:cysteine hydrolase [Clostridia bacterium]
MKNILLVIDMQNDFIDGALGTKEAVAIVDNVKSKIENFDGEVIFTRDTHEKDYLQTQEGVNLPVEHCICGTLGWEIRSELTGIREGKVIDKPTFGSRELAELLCEKNKAEEIGEITLVGLCTDICVISNALVIKAFLPEVKITVDASCCAGVTPESHRNALEAMRMCQINIEN